MKLSSTERICIAFDVVKVLRDSGMEVYGYNEDVQAHDFVLESLQLLLKKAVIGDGVLTEKQIRHAKYIHEHLN